MAVEAASNTLQKVASDWLGVKKSKVSDDHGDGKPQVSTILGACQSHENYIY